MKFLSSAALFVACLGCGESGPPTTTPVPPPQSAAAVESTLPPAIVDDPAVDVAATPTLASPPPPEATIKASLEKDMWGPPEQGGTRHTYAYRTLKIAPGRLGNYLTDGVPANTETIVHPVKVAVDITRLYTDGSVQQESKDQTYVFFVDEFGDWTYRFVQNN